MGKSHSKHLGRGLPADAQLNGYDEKSFIDVFGREVELNDSMQTLFRGNCAASKIMSHCFRTFGSKYLKQLLEPHIPTNDISYEIDSTKLEEDGDIDLNQQNLLKLTKQILDSILSSASDFPPQLNLMCICLRKVLCKKYPNSDTYLKAVGTVIFLRFINPAIVSPYEFGIVDKQPPPKITRGLMLVSKILQNIANNVEFSKEEHMLPFNDFVRTQFEPMRKWVAQISSEHN
jgi:neurofibromin 1